MSKREIELAADEFVNKFKLRYPSDIHCIHCKGCNCPYNSECAWCHRSFAFYCAGTRYGNTDAFLTMSILDNIKYETQGSNL